MKNRQLFLIVLITVFINSNVFAQEDTSVEKQIDSVSEKDAKKDFKKSHALEDVTDSDGLKKAKKDASLAQWYRAWCYKEDKWLQSWQADKTVAQNKADNHAATKGHESGVRWK